MLICSSTAPRRPESNPVGRSFRVKRRVLIPLVLLGQVGDVRTVALNAFHSQTAQSCRLAVG